MTHPRREYGTPAGSARRRLEAEPGTSGRLGMSDTSGSSGAPGPSGSPSAPGPSGSPSAPGASGSSGAHPVAHPVAYSEATMTQLMVPQWVNLHGTVHGGYILMLADQIAYVVASRHAARPTVTASFDEVDFRSPIHVGDIVTLHARVNYAGRTSLEIGVRVEAEDLFTREVRHTNSCYITMVAIDEAGRPVPVPELTLETDEERARQRRAGERRRIREERRRRAARAGAATATEGPAGAAGGRAAQEQRH